MYKFNDVARLLTAKTMVELFPFIDCKRGGLFVVEWTTRPVISTLSIHRHVTADDLDNIAALFQRRQKSRKLAIKFSADQVKPPMENVAGINKLSNTLIAYLSVMPDK